MPPDPPPPAAANPHAPFLAALPRIAAHARLAFRHVRCPDTRADLEAEAVALAWVWFDRLHRRGRRPDGLVSAIATFAARAARSGRRVCGQERAKDALSPTAQRRHRFAAGPLPDRPGSLAGPLADALRDNAVTPVPDQVQFRLDFPRWRAGLGRRDRRVADALAAGHRGKEVAGAFGLTAGRVSQVRRELHRSWRAFLGDDPN